MKAFRALAFCAIILSGCSKKSGSDPNENIVENTSMMEVAPPIPAAPKSAIDLIKDGNAEACVADEVKRMIVDRIMPLSGFPRGPKAAQYPKAAFLFMNATPIAILQAEKSIICHASLGLSLDGTSVPTVNRLEINYTVSIDLVHSDALILKADLGRSQSTAIMMLQAYGIYSSPSDPVGLPDEEIDRSSRTPDDNGLNGTSESDPLMDLRPPHP